MRRRQIPRLFGAKPSLIEATSLDSAYAARKPYASQDGVAIVNVSAVPANEPSLFDTILYGATAYGRSSMRSSSRSRIPKRGELSGT